MKGNKKKIKSSKGVAARTCPAVFFGAGDSFFEEKKNYFLGAVYEGKGPLAESIYELILKKAETKGCLSENDEKYLRQIQVAFKQFQPFLLSKCTKKIWDRYIELQSLIRENVKNQSKKPLAVSYETWKTRVNLSPWQEDLLMSNAITFQMTKGCSNYCRRCNEWALPKIRAHFSRDAVETILDKLMAAGNNELSLYGASDPLDWEESSSDLMTILSGLNFHPEFSLLTKIPKGKEELLKDLLEMGISLSVSLTDRNRSRIEQLEARINKSIPKQHATKDLLIPAGLDEDFTSVKPSITDGYGTEITPEGAFIIIPTFTSALHPFGHKKLPVTGATRFFPVKKLGRPALLVDYFKPLEVVGKENKPRYLPGLMDVQVESILLDNGSDELTPPGMRSLKEYLTIFDDSPRRQRQKMIPSVKARLEKEFLSQKFPSIEQKRLYDQKLAVHMAFCKKSMVEESRLCALSFFLAAIASFIKKQPVKTNIIAFLVKEEALRLQKQITPMSAGSLSAGQGADLWKIFRFYATSLTMGLNGEAVSEFIRSYPSRYDSFADYFVPAMASN